MKCPTDQFVPQRKIDHVQRERQGISGRRNKHVQRGGCPRAHTRSERSSTHAPCAVGEEFRTGPEMKRGLGHIINGFRNYVKG